MGVIVGLGIIAHDVCDGLNTMLLTAGSQRPRWHDYAFLALDALAPIAGGLIARGLFSLSPAVLMVFLSFAAGSFLYTATVWTLARGLRDVSASSDRLDRLRRIFIDFRADMGAQITRLIRYSPDSLPTFSTARNASCGISTRPTRFMRRFPSFCFSSNLRLRVISPP